MDQAQTWDHYSPCCSCWGRPLRNKPKAPSFQVRSGWKWRDSFSSKFASIHGVGFL